MRLKINATFALMGLMGLGLLPNVVEANPACKKLETTYTQNLHKVLSWKKSHPDAKGVPPNVYKEARAASQAEVQYKKDNCKPPLKGPHIVLQGEAK